jgi:hypothetical protein
METSAILSMLIFVTLYQKALIFISIFVISYRSLLLTSEVMSVYDLSQAFFVLNNTLLYIPFEPLHFS